MSVQAVAGVLRCGGARPFSARSVPLSAEWVRCARLTVVELAEGGMHCGDLANCCVFRPRRAAFFAALEEQDGSLEGVDGPERFLLELLQSRSQVGPRIPPIRLSGHGDLVQLRRLEGRFVRLLIVDEQC
eukprot:scaffold8531_cov130-Isochrysis_galbana.AAC.9